MAFFRIGLRYQKKNLFGGSGTFSEIIGLRMFGREATAGFSDVWFSDFASSNALLKIIFDIGFSRLLGAKT